MVPNAQLALFEGFGEFGHPFFVASEGDNGAVVAQGVLEAHHFALLLEFTAFDGIQGLIEDQLLPLFQRVRFDIGMQVDLHLASRDKDVDGPVGIGA